MHRSACRSDLAIDQESTSRASRWLQVGGNRDGLRCTLGYWFREQRQGALQPKGRQRQVESGRGEERVQGRRLEPPCCAPVGGPVRVPHLGRTLPGEVRNAYRAE